MVFDWVPATLIKLNSRNIQDVFKENNDNRQGAFREFL